MTLSDTEIENITQFAEHNPDASVSQVLGEFSCAPADRDAIEALLNGDEDVGVVDSEERSSVAESVSSRESLTPVEHYRRDGVREVYDVLGECAGVGLAGGVADFVRWYRYDRLADDTEATARGRIMTLSKDWDELAGALDRTLYASSTYTPVEWLTSSWTPTRGTGEDRVWRDEDGEWGDRAKPTPDYDEIAAQALLVDIDLPDDLKAARHRGEEFPKETVERALSYTVARFSALVGSRERVFLLDSAGGIYVLLPPAVTAPIVDKFPDDSGTLLDELTDRMNDWLEDIEADTKAEFPDLVRDDAADVLTFDDINHKNRIYKAPLAVHATYDAVVHPLDPSAPSYDPLPLADVSETEIERSRVWSEAFAADSETHREGVASVVSTLFAEIEAEDESWMGVLRAWLDEQDEPDDRSASPPLPPRPSPDRDPDAAVTAYVRDVKDAVDALDAERVGKDTIVSQWKESGSDRSGSGLRSFYPTWNPGCNGNANIMNLSEGVWIDTGEGDKGGAAKMALIAVENFPRRGGYATKRDWWRGVRLLRERFGYDIPVYVPPVGSTHSHGTRDRSPLWALCDAAVALGICRREGLIEKSGENGTYQDLSTPVYNATLDALDEAGIEHGRDRRGNGEARKSARVTLAEESDEDETEVEEFARETLIDLLSAE